MIDLRSDTVTKPCEAMREAMANAIVGDDVYGEDPTVNELESLAASITGMRASLFVPSGTQSNLLALISHCQRGDEYIVGQDAHTYRYEGGGGSVFGGIQSQPLDFNSDGELDLDQVRDFIKPDDFHFARTKLLCLENTQSGKALSLNYIKEANQLCKDRSLKLHLDGARLFNATVSLNVDIKIITTYFDSVSFCLSKGLGAPVGSVLCGSQETITQARRWRKVLGGGMRQAGILAAAGIYALKNNIKRLADDHSNAERLCTSLNSVLQLPSASEVFTNMVFVPIEERDMEPLKLFLRKQKILISGRRLVTHKDINSCDINRAAKVFKKFYENKHENINIL